MGPRGPPGDAADDGLPGIDGLRVCIMIYTRLYVILYP